MTTETTEPRWITWRCPRCRRRAKVVEGTNVFCSCSDPGFAAPAAPMAECRHLDAFLEFIDCKGCGSRGVNLPTYACRVHGQVSRTRAADYRLRMNCETCRAGNAGFEPADASVKVFSVGDLATGAEALASKLPPLRAVVGVARSGMMPAGVVATIQGADLFSISQQGEQIVNLGGGIRHGGERVSGGVAIIDDSAYHGTAMTQLVEHVAEYFGQRPIRAAVFTTQRGTDKLDVWHRIVPDHWFSWNMANAIWSHELAFDLDGVLCRDFEPHEDDDGPVYLEAMRAMRPTSIRPRTRQVVIITARLGKYRPQTLSWLSRHGIACRQLIMGPWRTKAEREADDVAAWKAGHLRRLAADGISRVYVESDPHLARRIASSAGMMVICPPASSVFYAE